MSTEYLKEFSFHPQEAHRLNTLDVQDARAELLHQIETTTVEVFRDDVVSPLCEYEIGSSGEFMWHGKPMVVDDDERNGATKKGFARLRDTLVAHPLEAVLFYSPKGPALFEEIPESNFSGINYTDGQLYIQYYDGEFVKTVAVQVGNEDVAVDIMEQFGLEKPKTSTQREFIEHYLAHPIPTGMSIHNTISTMVASTSSRKLLYKNKYGTMYPLQTALHIVRDTFEGRWERPGKEIAERIMRDLDHEGMWTERDIERVYIKAALMYAEMAGEDVVSFMGSCGGRAHSVAELGARLLGHGTKAVDVFASSHRLSDAVSQIDYKNDPNLCRCGRGDGPHFHCDGRKDDGASCGHAIVVGRGITECPSCHAQAVCRVSA